MLAKMVVRRVRKLVAWAISLVVLFLLAAGLWWVVTVV